MGASHILSSIVCLALATHATAATEPLRHVALPTDDPRALRALLEADGFDVLHTSHDANTLELIVSPKQLDLLTRRGHAPRMLATGRPFRDIDAEWRRAAPTGYPTLDEILAQLDAIEAAHPDIARVVDLTAEYGVAPTYEGRHIHALEISDQVAEREDEPAFLMVSNHHARETVTPVIALDAATRFTDGYASDAAVTALVDSYEIFIVPVWNPDGYAAVFDVDNMWRKNRRLLPDGELGVDLNRNYPFGWDSTCAGSTDTSKNTYKGENPESEAETQTMVAWSEDLHFARVLDYHSSGRETLWGYKCSSHPWWETFQQRGISLSDAAGYLGAERAPSAEGEHYQWQLAMMGSEAMLLETATVFQPDYADALSEAQQVWPATIWFLDRPIPLSGHVRAGCSGAPLEASIAFPDAGFVHGERNQSFLPFGRYHAFPPPGTHRVELVAPGYDTVTRVVNLPVDGSMIEDFELWPVGGCPCDPATLTARSNLLGAVIASSGASFSWSPDPLAIEYHLNSVSNKRQLNDVDPHREPHGSATLQCSSPTPACADADADSAGIVFYQALSACGSEGADEGPAL